MPTYITLMRMTAEGRREIAGSLGRGKVVLEKLAAIGVSRTDYFVTLGVYDCVMMFEAPNETAMAHALMEIGRLGAVETRTLTAIDKDDYAQILEKMAEPPA